MENKITTREWLPLIGMTVSAFIFNTSEFMPIGLLSDIAADFRMTEAQAGMLITIYAYVVMLMSLPLMIAASRYPLRKLLLATISLFAISHVASAFATGFWTLLLSRIGVAFAHSIFWSVASPIAVRLIKGPFKALAMSMIVTGHGHRHHRRPAFRTYHRPLRRLAHGLYVHRRFGLHRIGLYVLRLPQAGKKRTVYAFAVAGNAKKSCAHRPLYDVLFTPHRLLHRLQLYRAVPEADCADG